MRFRRAHEPIGRSWVLSRDEVGPREDAALFLGRLWAHFGPATHIDDGFAYSLVDDQTGIDFSAYSGASGPAYGASVSREELLPVVRELERLLASTTPADCSLVIALDIDYGGGRQRIGVRGGEPFRKRMKERGRTPRRARTYEDCLAIAKQRGGRMYGVEAGWQLCLEEVMPELPDEIEIHGRVYENCIGFGIDKKKGPVYAFDEGDGIEEIRMDRIPWPKPLPAIAKLWLACYDRWSKRKKKPAKAKK